MEPHRPPQNQPIDRAWLETKALRYTTRWEACRASVTELLERKLYERAQQGERIEDAAAEIPEVVEALVARGYIDDARFAQIAFARARREGRSAQQIRSRLAAKKIPADMIEALFREENAREEDEESLRPVEERAAIMLARRKRLGPFRTDPEQRRARRDRDLAALARQGFDAELSIRIIDAASLAELE